MSSLDENRIANRIGGRAYMYMAQCVSTLVWYGVYLSLFYMSLRVSRESRERTPKARKLLLALTCFMFLLNTGIVITVLSQNFIRFSWAFDTNITEITPSYVARYQTSSIAAAPYSVAASLFEIVNFIVGDAIVLWRAAVLWPESRLLRGGFLLLLLGDTGYSLYDMVHTARVELAISIGDTSSWVSIDAIRILVSFGVNLVATLCIAVKAWQFRRELRLGFSKSKTKKSLVNQILILLIECGAIFCAVQFFYAIYDLVVVPQSFAAAAGVEGYTSTITLFQVTMASFFALSAGMYPCLVIVIMAKQQSIFGAPTFIAATVTGVSDEPTLQGALALNFVAGREASRQTRSHSQLLADTKDPSKHGDIEVSVMFAPDAENSV